MLIESNTEYFKINPQETTIWTPASFFQGPLKQAIKNISLSQEITEDESMDRICFGSCNKNNIFLYNSISLNGQQLQEGWITSFFCLFQYQNHNTKFHFSIGDGPDILLLNEQHETGMLLEIANPNLNNIDDYKFTINKKFQKSYGNQVGLILFHNTRLVGNNNTHTINISEIKQYMQSQKRNPFNQIFIGSSSINGIVFTKIYTSTDGWHEDKYNEVTLIPKNIY